MLQNKGVTTSYSGGLHQHLTEVIGGRSWYGSFSLTHDDSQGFKNWLDSLKDYPDVVWYALKSIDKLMPKKKQKEGMKAAIEDYIKDNAVSTSPSEPYCGWSTSNVASNCCPKNTWRGKLEVTVVRAWDLYGDYAGPTDA